MIQTFYSFFETVPTWFRSLILIGGIIIFWFAEGILPLFNFKYKKVRHASINLFFTMLTAIIGFGLASTLLYTSNLSVQNQFGLLHLIDLPLWLQMILGVLLLDLIGAYLIHWIEHKIRWMWKFHLVHHSDTTVDVTTGLRHHPGETLFRIFFTILATLIIGAPISTIMLYQSVSVLFAHITHANIRMPDHLDRLLSWIFVTPNMHKVHHHYSQPLTDTNFGNIFSIWDRLFGTFAYVKELSSLTYGIDTHMKQDEHSMLINLLKIPFQPYRTHKKIE